VAQKHDENIPPEIRASLLERCGNQCEHCFTFGAEPHHKKYRSRCGPGDDVHNPINIAMLCRNCHNRTHDEDPEYACYRTASWQPIGRSEADPEFIEWNRVHTDPS
jgi:5-methylcytosine-specific restriction endonuclease McrA